MEAENMKRYYEAHGMSSDALVRCKDCRRLVPTQYLRTHGSCVCGCRRVSEVTALSLWEWVRIRVGLLRFPMRREFLREFSRV